MSDKLKNILIGLFALMAILITVAITLFLQPSIGDGKKTLHVRFSNLSGINVGTRVLFAGKPVGRVEEILEVADARHDKNDSLGRIYYYQLILKVDSSVEIYDSDSVTIQTTGLMGEKSIGIIPKAAKTDKQPKLINNQIIYAQSIDAFDNTVHQLNQLTEKVDSVAQHFDSWLETNTKDLTQSVKSLANIMKSMDNGDLISSINSSFNSFTNNMSSINSSLQEIKDNKFISKFNYIVDNFTTTSEYLKTDGKDILQNLSILSKSLTNENTFLGKMINTDDYNLNLNAILSKANTLMNDINHYGLLFQYDKHWKRQRTKRANILDTLHNPKEFREYYETEISEIVTSLSRISTLIEKNKSNKNSEFFKKDYYVLLKQVQSLMDSLKLYNQDLYNSNQ